MMLLLNLVGSVAVKPDLNPGGAALPSVTKLKRDASPYLTSQTEALLHADSRKLL